MKAWKVVWKFIVESQSLSEDCLLVTSTSSYYHIPVLLQDYVRIIIEVKNRYGI